MAATTILQRVDVAMSTKHSIQVEWSVLEGSSLQVRGYQIRYQAVGSHVVQYSPVLSASTFSHYITRLHENTAYDVCVTVLALDQGTTTPVWSSENVAVLSDSSSACVTGSTAIDALRLALGSTLGAFIALAIVVSFVLLAKCQHRRRIRRNRRRRRRSSDKTQPLTDSDDLSIVDYYDVTDDVYGGDVYNDEEAAEKDGMLTQTARNVPTSLNLPPRSDAAGFVVTEVSNVAFRGWTDGDMITQFSDRESGPAAEQLRPESAWYGSNSERAAACPAVLLDEAGAEILLGDQTSRTLADSASSDPGCEVTRVPAETVIPTRDPVSLYLATPDMRTAADSRDSDTGLLILSDVEATPKGLRPNHYSSLW